jgi:23S rRNA (adenine2030-N6)-methyltransferase
LALTTGEFQDGIAKLWVEEALPEALLPYIEVIEAINVADELLKYPGSPAIAQHLLREQDRLQLCELHNTEIEALEALLRVDGRAEVWHQDGFNRVEKLLPPRERRAVILIQPSYEIKEDYERVVDFITAAHRKFAQGLYLIWYPVVDRDRDRIDQMEGDLQRGGIRNIQVYELGITNDTEARGMTSSGMIVINPPWTLKQRMEPALKFLAETLGIDGNGFARSEQLVDE